MEDGAVEEMMAKNGHKKVIPTIIIEDQILMGYDRNRLKDTLGIK